MENLIKAAWLALAAIHLAPTAVLVAPGLVRTLYGVDHHNGDVGILLVHRGGLFLAVVAVCAFAAFDPSARRAASLVAAISVISFLAVYAWAGLPAGALWTIAIADLVALAPLSLVVWYAWREAIS